IDSSKQETFLSLGTSYLGKEVSYDRQQKKVLDKEINLTTYAPVNIYTVLEMLGEQMEITYKVDASTPQELAEKATAGEDILKNTVYTINFKGNLDEFIGYLSNLYDVSIQLKKNNLLEVKLYSNFAINLDYYGTDNNYEASLDISSNEAASSSGLKGKSTTSFKSSFWADVKDMMDKYISSGVYNIFQDSSILTFVGRQSEYNHVNKVLEQYKQANSRQFVVSYKIYIL
ncbi:type II and III secretion system protein, partial [Providencia huaxiensis]